jgi:hypothetical protein
MRPGLDRLVVVARHLARLVEARLGDLRDPQLQLRADLDRHLRQRLHRSSRQYNLRDHLLTTLPCQGNNVKAASYDSGSPPTRGCSP